MFGIGLLMRVADVAVTVGACAAGITAYGIVSILDLTGVRRLDPPPRSPSTEVQRSNKSFSRLRRAAAHLADEVHIGLVILSSPILIWVEGRRRNPRNRR